MKFTSIFATAIVAAMVVTSCSSDVDHPDKNILSTPKVTSVVTDKTATLSWDKVDNATAYVYSLDNGEEVTTTETAVSFSNFEPESSHTFKVKAQKTGSKYFGDSEYSELTFMTSAHVPVYHVLTYSDDWDTWHYEYNDDWTVKRIYRLKSSGDLDREWLFAYDGNTVNVTGKNTYTITLNDMGYAEKFVSGSNTYTYQYDEDGYMTHIDRDGAARSNLKIVDGNIMSWSKFSNDVEQWKDHTYTTTPNVAGVHCIYDEQGGASRWLVETGMFGKASVNLHETNGWDYSSSKSVFSFELDENNCVSQEIKDYNGSIENYYYTYIAE